MSLGEQLRYASKVRGCLIGGAIGDALGAPVEFWSLKQILEAVGEAGVREYLPADFGEDATGFGLVTDDTQMTAFTMEGLIRASVREDRGLGFTVSVVHHAYARWLVTQQQVAPPDEPDGWLASRSWLYSRRAPGTTCLSALEALPDPPRYGGPAHNNSKGCGSVMRSAPFGLFCASERFVDIDRFRMSATAAGYTHGHPTAQLISGALAVLIAGLVKSLSLEEAIGSAISVLRTEPASEESIVALERALYSARHHPRDAHALEKLGAGWVAEEALAIAVYSALSYPEPDRFIDALALAVTHGGDSDSTGAICGNILGAAHGATALPPALAFEVEGRGDLLQLADDFVYEFTAGSRLHGDYGPYTRWTTRYPGW